MVYRRHAEGRDEGRERCDEEHRVPASAPCQRKDLPLPRLLNPIVATPRRMLLPSTYSVDGFKAFPRGGYRCYRRNLRRARPDNRHGLGMADVQ